MQFIQAHILDAPDRVILYDYAARTDGQPEYIGTAVKDADQTTPVWTIFKLTYASASDGANISKKESVGLGKWSLRSAYFS